MKRSITTTSQRNFLITIKVLLNQNQVEQHFLYNKNDKGIKALFDNRYEGYHLFEKMILKHSLKSKSLRFLQRLEEDGKITLIYETDGNYIPNRANIYFTIQTKVPPFLGCEFCIFKKTVDELNFKCELKNKVMNKEVKNCSVFSQRKIDDTNQ